MSLKMTMDIASERQVNTKNSSTHLNDAQVKHINEEQTKIQIKRPFDVAFLMLPDEKLKQKEKLVTTTPYTSTTELAVRSDLINNHRHNQLTRNYNKVFIHGDYSGMFKLNEDRFNADYFSSTASSEKSDDNECENPPVRSAFSKVTQIINIDSPIPPAGSPDQLSCSSASPPISYSPPTANFRSDYSQLINSSAFQVINQQQFSPQKQSKSLIYRQNNGIHSPLNNSNNNNNAAADAGYLHAFHQFGGSQHPFMTHNPAAAILSTLLPTTMGSFSLPAQNVCAKCNISFRMTSDLVYHMRSHHKNESVQDPNRRRREEKLKCPVCSESFRERHHLTRHMTAHQDKEGDLLEHEIVEYHSRRK